jgi:hypothetical protein
MQNITDTFNTRFAKWFITINTQELILLVEQILVSLALSNLRCFNALYSKRDRFSCVHRATLLSVPDTKILHKAY